MNTTFQELWQKRDRLRQFINNEKTAIEVVNELSASKGWRERYYAAEVVAEFNLVQYVPTLIETFKANPESHTCRAFTKMVLLTLGNKGLVLLNEMKSACPPGPSSPFMLKVIENAIQQIKAA